MERGLRRRRRRGDGVVHHRAGLPSAFALVSAGVALLFAVALFAQWDTYLRFRYGKSFGVADPLYGVDVGFCVFHLPFYEMLERWLLVLLIVTLAIVVVNYLITGAVSSERRPGAALDGRAAAHISALLALVVADFGWGFYLGHYELLYSTMGVVYGAGYTAANVTRWMLWGMVALSAAACALCVLNVFRQRMAGLAIGAGVYAAARIVGIYLVPGLFQKFIVQPSELAMEKPYLTNYIDFTRKAFQLDAIKETSYPALRGSHVRGDRAQPGYDPKRARLRQRASASGLSSMSACISASCLLPSASK